MDTFHTVIVSDIHLGSNVSRADLLQREFENLLRSDSQKSLRQIIINGDLFEHTHIPSFSRDQKNFVGLLRDIARDNNGIDVVFVRGNHDPAPAEYNALSLGIPMKESHFWEHNGEKYLAIHGHIFDEFLSNNKTLSAIATVAYNAIQKIDLPSQPVSRVLKRISKDWIGATKRIMDAAMRHAEAHGASTIICSHTHAAHEAVSPRGVRYFNTGCWTDMPCTYLAIGDAGPKVREIW